MLLGTVLLVPAFTPAHGQLTGTVCIIPTSASSCPSSPATVTGSVGTQLRVSIFIQGSDGLSGWQIILVANHAILRPAAVDLTGGITPGPTILAECIGGVLIQGSACNPVDNPDTIELAVTECLGCAPTPTPTTGLLFTAIYNVTAATSTPIGYQTGCSNSSVSGTTTCVSIAMAPAVNPDPENVQTAVFSAADFSMTASPTTLAIHKSSSGVSTITLNSLNGFAGTVSLSTTTSPAGPHSPGAGLSAGSVTLSSGGSMSVTLTVSTTKHTAAGTYTVTVTGTSSTITHSVTVTVTVTH